MVVVLFFFFFVVDVNDKYDVFLKVEKKVCYGDY